jgi:predicted dehydrogenase
LGPRNPSARLEVGDGLKKLKLAVVGCGDIAKYTAQVARLVRQVNLSACCDTNSDRAKTFAKRNNIPQVFTNYAQMLENAPIDAVYLAVPHYLHYEMILGAVEFGRAVFVEKPLVRTLDEGRKLIEKLAGAKVGVNYQYRYDTGSYALGRAVQAGSLGKIHSVRINIPWHRKQNYFDDAAWHQTIAQAGGGTLITQGSHFLDIALWALGEHPISAMGYIATPGFNVEVDTLTHGIVETEGGALVSIASTMAAASEQAVTIEVYGDLGTARYTNLPLPSVKFIGVKPTRERLPVRGIHALHRSLAGFARWVLVDKPYLTPANDALPVLAAVDGIYRSASSGQREKIQI